MAELNKYSRTYEGEIAPVTMEASDTVTVNLGYASSLYIKNGTGADITINVKGGGASSVSVAGIGTIDVSGGKEFTIVDGSEQAIPLNTKYQEWLGDGTLEITGGTGCTAYVIEN